MQKPNAKQRQQGDVLITKIDAMPSAAKKMPPKARGYVIAEGEATGHAHTIATDAIEDISIDEQGVIYAQIAKQVDLVHEEHGPVSLDPGIYRFDRVQEYDHFQEEARQVAD